MRCSNLYRESGSCLWSGLEHPLGLCDKEDHTRCMTDRTGGFTNKEVKTVWRRHFSEIAKDASGVSKGAARWEVQPCQPRFGRDEPIG